MRKYLLIAGTLASLLTPSRLKGENNCSEIITSKKGNIVLTLPEDYDTRSLEDIVCDWGVKDERIMHILKKHPELKPYAQIAARELMERWIGEENSFYELLGLTLAIIYQESRGDPNAISPAGAVGIAQFMPYTAERYGLRVEGKHYFQEYERYRRKARRHLQRAIWYVKRNKSKEALEEFRKYVRAKENAKEAFENYKTVLFKKNDERLDPEKSIEAMITYLLELIEDYDGNILFALSAYNAGKGNVREYGGIPPFKETAKYVSKIIEWLRRFGFEEYVIKT